MTHYILENNTKEYKKGFRDAMAESIRFFKNNPDMGIDKYIQIAIYTISLLEEKN